MTITRKVKREAMIQARKTFRSAIKDTVILNEYQKRFQDGYESGYAQAIQDTDTTEDTDPISIP